jgi:hypothetical protein
MATQDRNPADDLNPADDRNPEDMGEEQLRAAYEAEIKRIRVEQVLLENVVTLINLGMRRTGLMAGTEDERDPGQVTVAVDSVRALLPMIERVAPEQLQPIREALSQLQLAFVQSAGQGSTGSGPAGPAGPAGSNRPAASPDTAPKPGEPGPAQSSGRLWVPGQ